MLPLMLTGNSVIRLIMLISQILVQLAMFPRNQALFVRLGMFSIKLVMDVIVALIELIMLPVVSTIPIAVMGAGRACKCQSR